MKNNFSVRFLDIEKAIFAVLFAELYEQRIPFKYFMVVNNPAKDVEKMNFVKQYILNNSDLEDINMNQYIVFQKDGYSNMMSGDFQIGEFNVDLKVGSQSNISGSITLKPNDERTFLNTNVDYFLSISETIKNPFFVPKSFIEYTFPIENNKFSWFPSKHNENEYYYVLKNSERYRIPVILTYVSDILKDEEIRMQIIEVYHQLRNL